MPRWKAGKSAKRSEAAKGCARARAHRSEGRDYVESGSYDTTPCAVWYRTRAPETVRSKIVDTRDGVRVCEATYPTVGAMVTIPGGVVHSTAPPAANLERRRQLLDEMFAFPAPSNAVGDLSHVVEGPPIDEEHTRQLAAIARDLMNDAAVPTFKYPRIHVAVDEGFKKKIRAGDSVGFERYASRVRTSLSEFPHLCTFEEAHVLVQTNASARFGAHIDKMQGDNDAHPVGHATVIFLGGASKLTLFFLGARKRKRRRAQ